MHGSSRSLRMRPYSFVRVQRRMQRSPEKSLISGPCPSSITCARAASRRAQRDPPLQRQAMRLPSRTRSPPLVTAPMSLRSHEEAALEKKGHVRSGRGPHQEDQLSFWSSWVAPGWKVSWSCRFGKLLLDCSLTMVKELALLSLSGMQVRGVALTFCSLLGPPLDRGRLWKSHFTTAVWSLCMRAPTLSVLVRVGYVGTQPTRAG